MPQQMSPSSFAQQPLDLILSGGGAIRVLRALLAHGGQLSVSRLAADTRMTPAGTRKVLHELVRFGIVVQTGSGRSLLYQAALSHPLILGFEQIFTAERHRYISMIEAVKSAVMSPEILAAWLFGSVARRLDGPSSDLDIAIVVKGDVDRLADEVRDEVREIADRSGFRVSITAMSPDDLASHSGERSTFWIGLTDAVPLKGETPTRLAGILGARK